MKKNSFKNTYKTRIICEDGSTLFLDFPYKKKNIYLTTDLTNNPLYKSSLKMRGDSIKNQHSKQEAFQFDFHSLINKN